MKNILLSLLLLCAQSALATDLILAKQISIDSKILNKERNLLVKLPEGYDQQTSTYPVLYVLHGQWDMLSTISILDSMAKELPGFIVVGVESKGMELRPNEGKLTLFAKYLSEEVVSFIKQNYAVAPFSILSGHSNSGRFVLDFWLGDNLRFSHYFAFSPSLEDEYIVNRIEKMSTASLQLKPPLTITIASEGEHMQKPFDTLTQLLKPILKSSFAFRKFPEQSHQSTKHPSMQFALKTTFQNWIPSDEAKAGGLDGLVAHYSALTQKYGFNVNIPINTLQRLAYYHATSEQENALIDLDQLIKFTLKQNGGSDALFEIADYLSVNEFNKAGISVTNGICNNSKKLKRCEVYK